MTDTPKCDLCGREMVLANPNASTGTPYCWYCPTGTPDQHKIATLEKQVAQLLAAAEERTRQINQLKEKLRNPEKRFIDLQSTLRVREADVLALREALEQAPAHGHNCEGSEDDETCGYCYWHGRRKAALSNTSATVEEIVARIGREAVEFIWKKASSCRGIHDPKVPCGTCYAALDEIRKFCAAGITEEKG